MNVTYLSFASLPELHNNSLLTVNALGELTNKARTYAKDPGVFNNKTATTLFNFLSKSDDTEIVMPQARALVQISIGDWLLAQAKLGNITSSRPNTLQLLKAQFTSGVEITDIGEMATDNRYWLPSFVQGNHIISDGTKEAFTLWFADEYFRNQYPVVTFTVIHPVPLSDIDSLVEMNYQQLEQRMLLETPDVVEKRAHDLTQNAAWPYTDRKVIPFNVYDRINIPSFVKLYWRWVEWGNGDDSEDQLFEQIQDEILANSQYPRSVWEEVVPDLFNPLEFYALPYYDRIGAVNKVTGAYTFSPIVDNETRMAHIDFYLTPNMTQDNVIKSTQWMPFQYKSLSCAFVGKVNNRAADNKIYAIYPDYQLTPSGDSDFEKMSLETTNFILAMENMLAASETVTPFSIPPAGISRINRFNKVWVAQRIGRVKIIVMTKWQMIQDDRVEA